MYIMLVDVNGYSSTDIGTNSGTINNIVSFVVSPLCLSEPFFKFKFLFFILNICGHVFLKINSNLSF